MAALTTHPVNPEFKGGYIVTVKRDGRATKVKWFKTYPEVEGYTSALRGEGSITVEAKENRS